MVVGNFLGLELDKMALDLLSKSRAGVMISSNELASLFKVYPIP
jgi:hypothetical protein